MKRIVLFLTVCILVITLFAGCGSADNKSIDPETASAVSGDAASVTEGTASAGSSEQSGTAEDRKINGESISKFKIVRQHYNGSYLTQIELEKLVNEVESKFGCKLEIVEDAYTPEGDFEIVVGNTNRKDNKEIKDYDAVSIVVKDKKVYLNGGHSYSTAAAVTEFTKMLLDGDLKDGEINESYGALSAGYDSKTRYKTVWHDDFDGDAIDTSLWRILTGDEKSSEGLGGKKSVRTDDPKYVGVADGKLYMKAGETASNYIGGMIVTDDKMTFKYGFLEFSQRLPQGAGFWIATWLSCNDDTVGMDVYHPEIDINEMFGNSSVVASNCHRWPTTLGTAQGYEHNSLDDGYGKQKKRYSLDDRNFNQDFHTFGCIHEPTYYAFTCDGEIYFKYDFDLEVDFDAFTHNTFIRISLANYFANSPLKPNATADEWKNSNVFYTDNIYLYQMDNGVHTLTLLK